MRRKSYGRKSDNRGLSLIELLVAVTILSIVVGVLLRGFILSAKVNQKAKVLHKATTLATDILEGLKAEDMDEIMQEFTYPTYSGLNAEGEATTYTSFHILPSTILSDLSAKNIGTFGTYAESKDGGATATYVKTADDKYYLYLRNMSMESTLFDALITIDGSAYADTVTTTDVGGVATTITTPATSGQNFNSQSVVTIPSMSATYDAVMSNCATYDEEAISALKVKAGVAATSDLDKTMLTRTITVDVDEEALLSATGRGQVVTVTYDYSYEAGGTTHYAEFRDVVFNNTSKPEYGLRYLFLFYVPRYDWKSDNINLNRDYNLTYDADNPVPEQQIYLVKQQEKEETTALTWETTYKANINVKETWNGALQTAASSFRIRTNLGYSLADATAITGNPLQANYYFNGLNKSSVPADAIAFFDINKLSNQEESDKIFDVTVTVYLNEDATSVPSGVEFFLGKPATETEEAVEPSVGEEKVSLKGTIRN